MSVCPGFTGISEKVEFLYCFSTCVDSKQSDTDEVEKDKNGANNLGGEGKLQERGGPWKNVTFTF